MKLTGLLQIIILSALVTGLNACSVKEVITEDVQKNVHEYINSTSNIKKSGDKLADGPAYEVYFTLDKTVECISVSLETVSTGKKLGDQGIPKKSFFVVEKIMEITDGTGMKQKVYIQIGKNYNSRWEVHNPVKICGNPADPVSQLGGSVFRVRFTTFDTKPVFFTITVYTHEKVNFGTDPKMPVHEAKPVK